MKTDDLQVLEAIARIIPALTHTQREKLLSFGEGMVFVNEDKDSFSSRKSEDNTVQHNDIKN